MGGIARSGSHLPEKSDCRIRQFARTDYWSKNNILTVLVYDLKTTWPTKTSMPF